MTATRWIEDEEQDEGQASKDQGEVSIIICFGEVEAQTSRFKRHVEEIRFALFPLGSCFETMPIDGEIRWLNRAEARGKLHPSDSV
jgi:hypothetical protein